MRDKSGEVVRHNKDTFFESDSQPLLPCPSPRHKLFVITKIHFLKAIHNARDVNNERGVLFVITKIHFLKAIHNKTTFFISDTSLFVITKIHFLKAIHNYRDTLNYFAVVVRHNKDTFFESDSQQTMNTEHEKEVVRHNKDTFFESDSQLFFGKLCCRLSCSS